MPKPKLFFGTGNPKKLKEIQEILGERYEIQSFHDLPEKIEVVEDRPDLTGNAIKKALEHHAAVGMPCFADDTGLEVEALGGRPGVYSARYAGPHGDAQANMEKLLAELEGKENRKARFVTVIAYYDGKQVRTFEGILEGRIGTEQKGANGFGYDPIFHPEDDSRTLAEYSSAEKNSISHRGRALAQFSEFLA